MFKAIYEQMKSEIKSQNEDHKRIKTILEYIEKKFKDDKDTVLASACLSLFVKISKENEAKDYSMMFNLLQVIKCYHDNEDEEGEDEE